ncbi:hypothetical protein J3A83DRAFT_4089915 [Scleroderma citrinum]
MDPKLSLNAFLKLLTSNDVPVSKAMTVASKIYKEFNTATALAQLDDAKLNVLGIEDKELRKIVLAAIHKAGYTIKPRVKAVAETSPSDSKLSIAITPRKKKRKRDDDLDNESLETPPDDASTYGNLDFEEILDEDVLRTRSAIVNRAPLMTAWAMIVAERLGFQREEALSIASVYTEMNAVTKGVSLGLIDESRKKEIETLPEGKQPYVDLMGRRPLYQTRSSKWLALSGGSPALPSTAFSYVSRSLRQTTSYVMGSLRLLADSYSAQELNEEGYSLYADFRPTVNEWGKRGEVRCARILSLKKDGQAPKRTDEEPNNDGKSWSSAGASRPLGDCHTPPSKKGKMLSLEEYEAALDDDLDDLDLSRLP